MLTTRFLYISTETQMAVGEKGAKFRTSASRGMVGPTSVRVGVGRGLHQDSPVLIHASQQSLMFETVAIHIATTHFHFSDLAKGQLAGCFLNENNVQKL